MPAAGDREIAMAKPGMSLKTTVIILGDTEMEVGAHIMPTQPAIGRHHLDETVRTPRNIARGKGDRPRDPFHINCRLWAGPPIRRR